MYILQQLNKEWEKKTERNLIYVAYTRAKKTLNFIKEDTHAYRTSGYFDMKHIKKELDELRTRLNYNRELNITEDNFKNKPIAEPVKQLGNTKPINNIIKQQNNTKKINFRNLL